MASAAELGEQLRELASIRDEGLITADEFDRLRSGLLDSWGQDDGG
jgi:hypothetical protein